jgi:hypothetical protein
MYVAALHRFGSAANVMEGGGGRQQVQQARQGLEKEGLEKDGAEEVQRQEEQWKQEAEARTQVIVVLFVCALCRCRAFSPPPPLYLGTVDAACHRDREGPCRESFETEKADTGGTVGAGQGERVGGTAATVDQSAGNVTCVCDCDNKLELDCSKGAQMNVHVGL